jgi:SAM-dependent methyltransferase
MGKLTATSTAGRHHATDAARLTAFYGAMSSLDGITAALAVAGVDLAQVRARDLYVRDLDCHNLGVHEMLEVLAGLAGDHRTLGPADTVLDVGCGMGGPGRFLVDRFGCSVVGIDLLPLRIEIAQALTDLTRLGDRITYHVADATAVPLEDRSVDEVWMLDVAVHVRDKRALFGEIGRVLRPGGLLVMHDQMAPIPPSMRPVTRQAPYLALPLPRLIRTIQDAGLRVLTWRDTTERVLGYFGKVRARLTQADGPSSAVAGSTAQHALRIVDGYLDALADHGSSTGVVVARAGSASRRGSGPSEVP